MSCDEQNLNLVNQVSVYNIVESTSRGFDCAHNDIVHHFDRAGSATDNIVWHRFGILSPEHRRLHALTPVESKTQKHNGRVGSARRRADGGAGRRWA